MPAMADEVVVVGGGLAGIATALAAADGGARVTLLEARPRLGGATFSFQREGLELDNGQHVYLRCCRAYQSLLERLGVRELAPLQPRLDVPVLAPGGRMGRLRRGNLPAPLHLAGTLARYPYLNWSDRLGVVRAALALRRLDPADQRLDQRSFGSWLADQGQSRAATDALWELVGLPTLNARTDQASLQLATMVFKTGLLTARDAADIGYSRVPLSRLHGEPAARALGEAGVRVRMRCHARAIEPADPGADGGGESRLAVRTDDDLLEADAVVVAVPHEAAGWLPARVVGPAGPEPWPMPGGVAVRRPRRGRAAGGGPAGPLPAGARRAVPRRPARVGDQLLCHQRANGDLPGGTRDRRAAAGSGNRSAWAVPGRVLDLDRLAGHHGGRGAQRAGGSACGAALPRSHPPASDGGGVLASPSACSGRRSRGNPDSSGGGGMSVQTPAILDRARVLTAPALRAAVARLEPSIAKVAAYHLGWVDVEGRPVAGNGGKAVRPALAVLSAEAVDAPAEVALPGAVAVELVHNFSLLHDDLMDGDEERRHRPTSWKVFGPAMAILAGDALLALAEDVLLEAPVQTGPRAARHLTEATDRLITGQAEDLSFEGRLDVSVQECLTMAGNKTGALLACSASIGAVLAGAPSEAVEALSGFGYHLGLAFQAVDDLLGIWGQPEVTGKPAWSDLRQRKKSVPVAHALSSGGRVAERLSGLLGEAAPDSARVAEGGRRLSDEDLALAAKLVQEAGGRDWTMAEAERQLVLALRRLDSVAAPERALQELVGLARFVTSREL